MKNLSNLVVGIGEALWDVLPEGKKIGGAPANFAYHVSQFGFNSRVISAVGDDELGQEILDNFNEKRLNCIIDKIEYPTGTVQVTLDSEGIPQYEIKVDVAWSNIPFTSEVEEVAKNCRAVCFGSLAQYNSVSRETINKFLDAMPDDSEHYKIFDINLRQKYYTKEIIDNSMNKCNILKINDEEMVIINEMFGLGEENLVECAKILVNRYNLKMLILTCGTNGSYVVTREETSFIETPKVIVGDTVGAGDSFTAGFIASILNNKSIKEAHRIAVDVSAFVCTQHGAMPVLPENLK